MIKSLTAILQQKKPPKWLSILLIITIILLIVSAVLRSLTPVAPTIPPSKLNQGQNANQQTSSFANIEFVGAYPQTPDQLPVAVVNTKGFQVELERQLVETFNLIKDPDFSVWTGPNYSLSLQDNQYYILSKNISNETRANQETSKTIGLTEALKVSEDFIDQHLPQHQVEAFAQEALFLDGGNEFYQNTSSAKTDSKQSESVLIPFNYALQGYPIFYADNHLSFVEIIVGAEKIVTKATFNTVGLEQKSLTQLSLLSIDEVLMRVNQMNQARLVSFSHQYADQLTIDEIKQAKLEAVKLEYRVDPENSLAYPFYRFSGQFTNKKGQNFTGELIAPAVKVGGN